MTDSRNRIVSGMRPTGALHLGHYHGVLKNWLELQHEYPCYFFVADWHALTTHYEHPDKIAQNVKEMLIDWLSVGINPGAATLFVQSWVPEHAELHLLLSMLTPLGWLERVPTYKDQQQKLNDKDLSTYGFLGYPLLQSADILLYRSEHVPVGEDQVAHVEIAREVARRFNYLYGREPDFEKLSEEAISKMGKKVAKRYRQLKTAFQQEGDHEALATAQALIDEQANINLGDKERLLGYLEGHGKHILTEPQALLTANPKVLGTDGQKMSKSYNNIIYLRDDTETVTQKIKTMQTDPARVKRTDPGEPTKCPVYSLHQLYSDQATQDWVGQGCRSAGIGCLDCKQPLLNSINQALDPIREAAQEYSDASVIDSILAEGSERAREEAEVTMKEVREAMGLAYK